jgi:hypothetical protein
MKRTTKPSTTGIAVSLLIMGVVAAAIFLSLDGNKGVTSHGRQITGLRTLLVGLAADTGISEPGKPLRAVLVSGAIPSTSAMGTVTSDENCAPDAAGFSHCLNKLKMDDGGQMAVIHTHRMADVPCLSPGERVRVTSA